MKKTILLPLLLSAFSALGQQDTTHVKFTKNETGQIINNIDAALKYIYRLDIRSSQEHHLDSLLGLTEQFMIERYRKVDSLGKGGKKK